MPRWAVYALATTSVAGAMMWACSFFVPEVGTARTTLHGDGGLDGAIAVDAGDAEGGADGLPTGPMTYPVMVAPNGSMVFSPAMLTIHSGDTVHWIWGTSDHTVTSGTGGVADGLFCSPSDTSCSSAATSSAGATYDHVFPSSGVFPYFCRIHGFTGTITVQ